MRGEGTAGRRIRIGLLIALAGVLALGALATGADAKKKKKKKAQPAVTITATTPFSSASTGTATANCTGKTHVSGGGWVAAPHLVPNPPSGLRSLSTSSIALGTTGWTAASDAFANPPGSGTFSAVARCESNKLGKLVTSISGSATVPTGQLTNLVMNCPAGTHVVSAGYAGTGLASYVNNIQNLRILVLQSRRTAVNQWTISAFESNASPASGNITVSAVCERDAKGRSIGEVSTTAAFGNLSRASGDPSCAAKQHVVSGGYALSPISGNVPVVGIDEFEPTSKSTWHLGLFTFVIPGGQPPGSSVTSYAYCAKDTLKKKHR